jgi:cytochrome c-type protein NapB
MKFLSKITLSLAVIATVVFTGCNDDTPSTKQTTKQEVLKPVITEASLGLRKTDLYSEKSETFGDEAKYSTTYAGSGHKINRAFQDAPPMIPHDTEGMLPITIKNNQCVGCHMPEVASSMGATAIPVSHLTDFRPKHKLVGQNFSKTIDNMKNQVSIKENKNGKLTGARFNCSQCHAPQSTAPLAVENNFEASYTSKDGANKSSWNSTKYMDSILETVDGTKESGVITSDDLDYSDSAAGTMNSGH